MKLTESYKARLQELAGIPSTAIKKDLDLNDDDAIPFLYYEDKLYIKNVWGYPEFYNALSHWDIVGDILSKLVENKEIEIPDDEEWHGYEQDILNEADYNGRLWINSKVISFWHMPENNDVLIKIINDLNGDSMGRFSIDGSWSLAAGGDYVHEGTDLIKLSDYTGGEISAEEKENLIAKWKAHIMSPLEKSKLGLNKVPAGFGSKNPNYAGHRAIDRAVGRAVGRAQ